MENKFLSGRIRLLKTLRAYRELFFDGTGQLKAAAKIVLADLWNEAGMFKDMPADAMTLALYEGRKQIVNHIHRRARTGGDREWLRRFAQGEADEENGL